VQPDLKVLSITVECGLMPNVMGLMAALSLLESRAVMLPIQENTRLGRNGKIPLRSNSPENVYI